MPLYTDKTIKSRVAFGCSNKGDVMVIQQLLNAIPLRWGGPTTPLPVNGVCDAMMVEAIKGVQRRYFDSADGAVDVNKWTLQILNEMNRHLTEKGRPPAAEHGGDVAPAVVRQTQASPMLCWATAMAMLQTWWYREHWTPEETTNQAGDEYYDLFRAGDGLTDNKAFIKGFLENLDYVPLDSRLAANSPAGWRDILTTQPVAVMLRKSWGYHVRVAYGIKTDGTVYGTSVHIADPDGGREYWESFHKFARLYTASADMSGVRIWGY